MKLVIATNNNHKLIEFRRMLEPLGYQVVGQDEVCPHLEVEEDGTTFAENAYKKAWEIFKRTGLPTVADDSGLCVDALDGAPGVYSARYAGAGHDSAACNAKLLKKMERIPPEGRTARFVCAICCILAEGDVLTCEGACPGTIGYQLLGSQGFGYDPLFMVGDRSFAQLSDSEKDAISHRGIALKQFEEKMKLRGESHC